MAAIGRSELNSVSHTAADTARQAAADVDLRLPLAGVPFLVKETEQVAGWPWAEGAAALADRVATRTSTNVSRLIAAGAIPVGQATSAEYARAAYTATALHGITRNPWDPARTPGGSSGGSAAAVAGGIVPLATATDGGGSIRLPAAYCGLPGLKVTMRLIPAGPRAIIEPLTVVIGHLTRTVRDLARVLDVTCGNDGRDIFSSPVDAHFEADLDRFEPRRVRVGHVPTFANSRPESFVADAVSAALGRLVAALPIAVVPIVDRVPAQDKLLGLMGAIRILGLQGAAVGDDEHLLNPEVRAALDVARSATTADVAGVDPARIEVIEAMAEMFEDVDVIVTPTVPGEAFGAWAPPAESPASALWPANVSGFPAITVPIGRGPTGLPIGMQLIGRPYSETLLLGLAHRWEVMQPWPLTAGAGVDER